MTMKNSRKFDFRTAYIDLLIALLMGTVVIFMLTTLLIAPITKNNEGIKKNADFLISLEWPNEIDCDVDLWVRDPLNNIVSFKIPESGLMYYERDDMGKRRSVFDVNGVETTIDPDNKEYITLRGTFPGEYVINVHLYSCLQTEKSEGMREGQSVSVPVSVELTKINPTLTIVKHVDIILNKVWQEKTAIRFVVDDQKNVIRFMSDFVRVRKER
jgi:hypothetical protein